MGNQKSQISADFENARKISEKKRNYLEFDTENDAKTYANSREKCDIVTKIVPKNDKFVVEEHFMPPLWLGVYTISNERILQNFLKWAHINGYVTSVRSDDNSSMVAVGSNTNLNLDFGIPNWYSKISEHELACL